MTRHLIIPGMAKAGTTFLFEALAFNTDVFNLPKLKEINFFIRNESRSGKEQYMRQFRDHDPEKIYLDASPSYFQSQKPIAKIVNDILDSDDDVRFIVLLRDPGKSLFSHYLHDLKSNVCRISKLGSHKSFSLFDEKVLTRYVKNRSEAVRQIVETFPDRVLGMDISEMFAPGAAARVGAFLDVTLQEFDSSLVSNPGGWIPRYYYGAAGGTCVAQGGLIYEIPPRALVVASNDRSEIAYDIDEDTAAMCFSLQATFTREIEVPAEFFDPVYEDYVRCCHWLGLSPRDRPSEETLRFSGAEPEISEKILCQLRCTDNVDALARRVFEATSSRATQ